MYRGLRGNAYQMVLPDSRILGKLPGLIALGVLNALHDKDSPICRPRLCCRLRPSGDFTKGLALDPS